MVSFLTTTECRLRVIRDRVKPAASLAMSAMPPKAEAISERVSGSATDRRGLDEAFLNPVRFPGTEIPAFNYFFEITDG